MGERVDYGALPQVVKQRERHEELLDPKNTELDEEMRKKYKEASHIMKFPEGTELLLRVKVTDSFLFQYTASAVLSESYEKPADAV